MDLSSGYTKMLLILGEYLKLKLATQIRIVADTSQSEENGTKPKKKKKSHRGYAFVVYEREKDMKGIASIPHSIDEEFMFL